MQIVNWSYPYIFMCVFLLYFLIYELIYKVLKENPATGIPGWRSGLAPAFGPGRDPEDPGSNPTSGSLQEA